MEMTRKTSRALACLLMCAVCLAFVVPAWAQDEKADDKAAEQEKPDQEKKKKSKFKVYADVITDEAQTKEGVFKVHVIDDKVYYEIPETQFGQEFVWVSRLGKTQTSFSNEFVEVANRVVRWERSGDNVLLRNVEFVKRADEDTPMAKSIERSTVAAILKSFKIVSFSPEEKSPVIEVTSLFTGDTPEFSPKIQLRARNLDKSRTFVDWIKAFPTNIEVNVVATFNVEQVNFFGRQPPDPAILRRSDPTLASATVEVRHSMVALPDRPMRPRPYDLRVGYFTDRFEYYTGDDVQVETKQFITRWRLEKKDPKAEVSEPVKPIVFYIGREVPEKWKKYVKEGIEQWQPAFEAAGFKNAIIGKFAPDPEEDPDWDPDDARISSVRWIATPARNAYGPHISDPRTGEILESDIAFFHNHVSTYRNWFFVQASMHYDGGKHKSFPLDEELMGMFVRRVVAHEVGHTIGLRHNYKASHAYTVEQLRDPEWTKKNGISTSMMEYARCNYVAQPGDGADIISKIGPYDFFAIEWGYKQFPGTSSAEDDKPYLEEIAKRQIDDPYVRFGGGREDGVVGIGDPYAQTEDLGSDAVEATRLGFMNLARAMDYIVEGTSTEGEDYRLLTEVYGFVINQIRTEINHVANVVGGVEIRRLMYGQGENVFSPLPADEQKRALDFVLENGLKTPEWLVREDVVSRIGMNNINNQIFGIQSGLLRTLFWNIRIQRMADVEAAGYETFTIADLVEQTTDGVFEELDGSSVDVDIFRRNLQRAYVDLMTGHFVGKSSASVNGDLKALSRAAMIELHEKLEGTESKAADAVTKAHLIDLANKIEAALEARMNLE